MVWTFWRIEKFLVTADIRNLDRPARSLVTILTELSLLLNSSPFTLCSKVLLQTLTVPQLVTKISRLVLNPKDSFPHSQQPANCPHPKAHKSSSLTPSHPISGRPILILSYHLQLGLPDTNYVEWKSAACSLTRGDAVCHSCSLAGRLPNSSTTVDPHSCSPAAPAVSVA